MLRISLFVLLFLLLHLSQDSFAQTAANDNALEIAPEFLLGVNPGYYNGWDDELLADIGFGNPSKGQKGAGLSTLRGFLPAWFLDQWGYDIRVDEYEYFDALGGQDYTITIGYPALWQRETTEYCPGIVSEVFANLYLPIWDNGALGTPVNDENHFALYVYKMATTYKGFAKIYEVWNEPDYDLSGNGWKEVGEEGNWWENIPEPCDTRLRAPIFSYIRMLRIAYEVVKSIDSKVGIAVGGLGYESYLDLILRHTDNPNGGAVTDEYPLLGGAWFDVMSFHTYPHFDGSLRAWDNDLGDFAYFRHSDAATAGVYGKLFGYRDLLSEYGYDGQIYPEKVFINTESNIPRVAFDNYIGSDAAQVNFLMKTILLARKYGLRQFHIYKQGEDEPVGEYNGPFDAMGLFEALEDTPFSEVKITNAGIACATLSKLTKHMTYDPELTESLNLPDHIDGLVFVNNDRKMLALWAKTTEDLSESASATYAIPNSLLSGSVEIIPWDFAHNNASQITDNATITLSARPVFVTLGLFVNSEELSSTKVELSITENPGASPSIFWNNHTTANLSIVNNLGQIVFSNELLPGKGSMNISDEGLALSEGLYHVILAVDGNRVSKKMLLIQ